MHTVFVLTLAMLVGRGTELVLPSTYMGRCGWAPVSEYHRYYVAGPSTIPGHLYIVDLSEERFHGYRYLEPKFVRPHHVVRLVPPGCDLDH